MRRTILLFCAVIGFAVAGFGQSGQDGPLTWVFEDGTLTISGEGAMPDDIWHPWFVYRSGLITVDIKEGVTKIGDAAFVNFMNLTSITIPNSVTSIGEAAFIECSSLTSITIPNSVTSIGKQAFRRCSSLTSITTFPGGVTSIGSEAFSGCSSLTSIILNGVTSIGDRAFSDCSSLSSITITISEGVTDIRDRAFYECSSLTSITIPQSVTNIGESAFEGCSDLQSITVEWPTPLAIPANVFLGVDKHNCTLNVPESSLEAYQTADVWKYFFHDSDFKVNERGWLIGYSGPGGDVVIPNDLGIKEIWNGVFANNINITSVIIPESVIGIRLGAFYKCSNLTSITIPNSVTIIDNEVFSGCSSLTSITLPNGVTSIGSGAFYSCYNLTSITIPNSVTSIGNQAFAYCYRLSNVEVQWDKPLTINNTVFAERIIDSPTLIVPAGTKTLYKAANVWKDFKTIIEKDDSSTSACDNPLVSGTAGELTWTFSCPDGTLTISGEGEIPNFDYLNIPWYSYHSSIKTVDIKEGVTSIGEGAFYSCYNLTSVAIPNSVTNIGVNAFNACLGLTSITIPNSVTNIGAAAFYRCISLTSIVIPNSVTSIGDRAFNNCYSLSNVEVQWANPLIINNDVFGGINLDNATLTVSVGTKSLYEAAAVWKDFGTIVEKQQEVVVDEGESTGTDGIGKFELSLTIPTNVAFTGTFKVELPDGLHLDVNATKLAGDLGLTLNLSITQNADGSWSFSITGNSLRSARETTYQKIVQIVYTVDESVANGSYDATISDLEFVFEDGAVIRKDEIPVNITVDHTSAGIVNPSLATTVRVREGKLFVNSATGEQISIYSVSGQLLYQAKKQAGEAGFTIGNIPNRILIVKGGSGWVKKVY